MLKGNHLKSVTHFLGEEQSRGWRQVLLGSTNPSTLALRRGTFSQRDSLWFVLTQHGPVSSTDCGRDMVYVQAGHCQRGLVAPCPQSCQQLSTESNCHSSCVEGESVALVGTMISNRNTTYGQRCSLSSCVAPVQPFSPGELISTIWRSVPVPGLK